MTKKLLKFFTLQPDEGFEGVFFKRNSEGKILFYPWGDPGESYFISEGQQNYLKIFEYVMFFLLLFFPFLSFIFFDQYPGTYNKSNWIIVIPFTIYLVIHFAGTSLLIKNLEANRSDSAKKFEAKKSKAILYLLGIAVGQIVFGLFNLPLHLLESSLFVTVLYSALVCFLYVKKGYVFQKKV